MVSNCLGNCDFEYVKHLLHALNIKNNCHFSQIQQIVSSFCSSLHIELQQRGVEFTKLFGKYGNLSGALLERMPPMEINRQNDIQTNGDADQNELKNIDDSPQHVTRESVRQFLSFRVGFLIVCFRIRCWICWAERTCQTWT